MERTGHSSTLYSSVEEIMGTNIKQFQKEMQQMEDDVKDAVASVIRDAILSGYENSLRPKDAGGAPRQTGWLRSNIFVTFDQPEEGTVGSKESVDTSKRERLASEFKGASTDKILGSTKMFISYTVPYAKVVNDGSSRQRGQHFVERSIQDLTQTLIRKRNIK